MLSIKVGDLTLVDSGSIIVPEGQPVHFLIKDLEYIYRKLTVKASHHGKNIRN